MISFVVKSNKDCPDVFLDVVVDGNMLTTIAASQIETPISIDLSDREEGSVLIELILKNKKNYHTVLEDGKIVDDLLFDIDRFRADDIEIDHMIQETAVYQHSFNKTHESVVDDRFFGSMGCNGRVMINITCPLYMWLLENM